MSKPKAPPAPKNTTPRSICSTTADFSRVFNSLQSFGSLLKQQFNLPVYYQDERLTTVAAQKTLLNNDTSRQKRRQVVDKLAATLILSTYLENPNNIK